MKEDSDGITARKCDVGTLFSMVGFGDSWGYYVCAHHLSCIFPQGGAGISLPVKPLAIVLTTEYTDLLTIF